MMPAEIIIVSGPLTGCRYALGAADFEVGRDPALSLSLPPEDAAWRHCKIQLVDGHFQLADLRSGRGTYVNGLRAERRVLEDGDQISIGETDLLFRSGETLPVDNARAVLMRSCSLLFLFRALEATREQRSPVLDKALLALLGEFIPHQHGVVLLAGGEADLRTSLQAAARELKPCFDGAWMEGISEAGALANAETGDIAVVLYARSQVAGVICLRVARELTGRLPDQLEILSAIGSLASAAIENERKVESLRGENTLLQERLEQQQSGLIGESAPMRRLAQMIARVAAQNSTVLILGESGTGKELVARALHQQSPRSHRPFVAINCAAISDALLESELFGHEKGSFTGAVAQKKGKLEMAEGGTVFLDEMGELAPALQAKLLRVLQQREFERVGGTRTHRLDVRVIAATNRDLSAEVKRGAFREDLYHRLNVIALRTPPLCELGDDILLMARSFLKRASVRCGRRVEALSPEAETLLMNYSWPGNVRELENAIERAVVLGQSDAVLPEDLPETVLEAAGAAAPAGAFHALVGQAKRDSIVQAWEKARGDYKAAAQLLGLHPNSLLRLVRNLGLRQMLK